VQYLLDHIFIFVKD